MHTLSSVNGKEGQTDCSLLRTQVIKMQYNLGFQTREKRIFFQCDCEGLYSGRVHALRTVLMLNVLILILNYRTNFSNLGLLVPAVHS